MSEAARLDRYAELAVRVGANVRPGQLVIVWADVVHAPLVEAVVRAAYRAGARWVGARYADVHLKRALAERRPLIDVALEEKVLPEADLKRVLDPLPMTRGGVQR